MLANSMALICLTWSGMGLLVLGLGLGLQRLFGLRGLDDLRLFQGQTLGLCVLVFVLILWHFVLPIQWPALAVLVALAAAGLLSMRRDLADWLRE
jgi:hypothetical protein